MKFKYIDYQYTSISISFNYHTMFRNYFKTAVRNMMRNPTFSFINIFGLGLGIACSLFIYLWVRDERSYDDFHANGDRLYKIIVHSKDKSGGISASEEYSPGLLAEALKKEIPEVQYAAMVAWDDDLLFTVNEKSAKENGRYASPDFFEMFSFPLAQGDAKTALSSPDNIVISQKLADNYFGKQNPIGKSVRIDDRRNYIVSGVVADPPENSSIKFDFMLPIQPFFDDNQWLVAGWGHYGPATYVMLHANASVEKVNAKIRNFISQHDKKEGDKTLSLQSYKDMYLYSRFTNGVADGGRIEYVRLFSIIGVFILLIACINFMNLATARSVKRAKEIGVRKVVGAEKGRLVSQFLLEALVTTLLAVVVAVVVVTVLLPAFNRVTEKHLSLNILDPFFIFVLICLTIATGIIAGSYPALFLSSLNPLTVLKGSLKFKAGDIFFRKGLVVFQFTLSVVLIVCTAIVYKQLNFVQTKNLGLDRSNIIYIPLEGDLAKNYAVFKRELMPTGLVQDISQCTTIPTNVHTWSYGYNWPGKDPNEKAKFMEIHVGYDFLKTMKIQLSAGRDFSPDYGADSGNFIINEEAARRMNMRHPVGETMSGEAKGTIIGLIKNFNARSLHDPVEPLIINLREKPEGGYAIVRAQPGRTRQAMTALETAYRKFNAKYPFEFTFADDHFAHQYHSEMMVGQLADIFAFIAVFISCMGLFGLSMFMAEQRTKEIGIRKVVGASVARIVVMLSTDFLVLVIIAFVIASPFAWWAMSKWLQGFAYKTDIGWVVFALSGFAAIVIALGTIGYQAIKAAVVSPVKSLRTE
ncbi:MAG TPA: ABC transporter permease [Puia sp.]|nr:ABC transporter permease [Puia sp.]